MILLHKKIVCYDYLHLTVSSVASRTQVKGIIIPVGIKQSTVNVEGIKWCPHNSPDDGGILKKKLFSNTQLHIFKNYILKSLEKFYDRCIKKPRKIIRNNKINDKIH